MHRFWCCGFMLALAGLMTAGAAADEKPKASGEVVLTGVDGKDTKLSAAKFTPTGTRRLAWLADPKATTPEDKLGPLAIKLREQESTTLVDGVLTLIPPRAWNRRSTITRN
ncbi:MAG: hypothetical protein U0792_16795 [Gemmataceae bacterium]